MQAYVQGIIEDFGTAYRKLDFSDPDDPMRLVNLQLKEQAEAAVKDKVATMSVHEVLSDKQPIIEELTSRPAAVAEGLGLRIVTVQIKEASTVTPPNAYAAPAANTVGGLIAELTAVVTALRDATG